MNDLNGRRTRRLFAAATALMGALVCVEAPAAYTIITRDGHRIEAEAKPEIKGLQAFLRLPPHGKLAMIQEEKIDWALTEAANPARPVLAVPADAKLAEKPKPAPAGPPIEVRIVGGASTSQEEPPKAEEKSEAKKIRDQEGLINLQREYARLQGLRDQAAEQKQLVVSELEELRSQQAGYAGDDNSQARRIRELEDRLGGLNQTIDKYETRMNDIRAEAIDLGGSID